MRRIALFSAGQVEGDGMAVEIGLQVDLRGEAAAGAAERLAVLPPLAPAAETWARAISTSSAEINESEPRFKRNPVYGYVV